VKIVVSLIALLVIAFGVASQFNPTLPIDYGSRFLNTPALYAVGVLRVLVGFALINVAPRSFFTRELKILGMLIVAIGVATPIVGVDRTREIVGWFAKQGPDFMRLVMGGLVIVAAFVIFAVLRRDRKGK